MTDRYVVSRVESDPGFKSCVVWDTENEKYHRAANNDIWMGSKDDAVAIANQLNATVEPVANDVEDTATQFLPGTVFVNVYEANRAYGGPEEGGWWYDTGVCVYSRQVMAGDAGMVTADLATEYPSTGKRYSVIYQGGDYDIRTENAPGVDYPTETPHYS